jgi:hypothetical protein
MPLPWDHSKTLHDFLAVGSHDVQTRSLAVRIDHRDRTTCTVNVDSDVFVHGALLDAYTPGIRSGEAAWGAPAQEFQAAVQLFPCGKKESS